MTRTIGEDIAAPAAGAGPAVPETARRPLQELMDDRLLDALLERSRDQAGRTAADREGSMLGELDRAVLERALESPLPSTTASPVGDLHVGEPQAQHFAAAQPGQQHRQHHGPVPVRPQRRDQAVRLLR